MGCFLVEMCRRSRALLAAPCLVLMLGTDASADEQEDSERAKEIVATAMATNASELQLVQEFSDLGTEAIPALILAWEQTGSSQGQGELVHRALTRTLSFFESRGLLAHLGALITEETSVQVRIHTIRLLGSVGSGASVPLLINTLVEAPPRLQSSSKVMGTFRLALMDILRRDPAAAQTKVFAAWKRAPVPVLKTLIQVVSDLKDRDGYARLVKKVGARPAVDGMVLVQLGAIAEDADRKLEQDILEAGRRCLSSNDPATRGRAAALLARLNDVDSIEPILSLLESDDRRVSRPALDAVQQLTGVSFYTTRDEWSYWWSGQQVWLETEGARCLSDLRSGQLERVLQAAAAVSQRRVFRSTFEDALVELLRAPEAKIRSAACWSLARLGSRNALPRLQSTLSDSDPHVREAAWQALRAISGKDLPLDASAWTAVVGK